MPDDVHYFYKYKKIYNIKKAGLAHTNIVQYFHIHKTNHMKYFTKSYILWVSVIKGDTCSFTLLKIFVLHVMLKCSTV